MHLERNQCLTWGFPELWPTLREAGWTVQPSPSEAVEFSQQTLKFVFPVDPPHGAASLPFTVGLHGFNSKSALMKYIHRSVSSQIFCPCWDFKVFYFSSLFWGLFYLAGFLSCCNPILISHKRLLSRVG